jgi:integrase
MGLGSARDFSLAEPRLRAKEARQKLADKIDPLEVKRAEQATKLAVTASKMTFKQCAEAYIAAHRNEWRSADHGMQWLRSLANYVYPLIGSFDVAQIGKPAVLRVLKQPVTAALGKPAGEFWTVRTVTANRTRNRIELILNYAVACDARPPGFNPAAWSGLKDLLSAPKKTVSMVHHPAVPYSEIPALIANLRGREGSGAAALRFVILTATRAGEALGATWSEIDLNTNVWTIPAERMKAGKEHKIPLAPAVVELLNGLYREDGGNHLFIGPRGDVLSKDALTAALRRLDRTETIHGFRSSFSTWASERTAHSNHTIEISLAHTVGNAVERSYRRGDMFAKRAKLMADWAIYCTSPVPVGATVTPMIQRGR